MHVTHFQEVFSNLFIEHAINAITLYVLNETLCGSDAKDRYLEVPTYIIVRSINQV